MSTALWTKMDVQSDFSRMGCTLSDRDDDGGALDILELYSLTFDNIQAVLQNTVSTAV